MKHEDITIAIANLRPGAEWALGADGLIWFDESQDEPSMEVIEAEVERIQLEREELLYQSKRASEYPPIEDFADAFYWLQKGDRSLMDSYLNKVESIKEKFPKKHL